MSAMPKTPTPYRMAMRPASSTTRERLAWWVRLLARLLPVSVFATDEWYRSAIGGRWTITITDASGIFTFAWCHVTMCPGPTNTRAYGTARLPDCAYFDDRVRNLGIDEECGVVEHTAHACHCEEWP